MFDILLCKIGGFMNELTVSGKKKQSQHVSLVLMVEEIFSRTFSIWKAHIYIYAGIHGFIVTAVNVF